MAAIPEMKFAVEVGDVMDYGEIPAMVALAMKVLEMEDVNNLTGTDMERLQVAAAETVIDWFESRKMRSVTIKPSAESTT